jgi:predicted HTH domain antitoxin
LESVCVSRHICMQNSIVLAGFIMAKTQNLTVRLEKELIKEIEQEAQHERTDKSTVARKLIAVGIEQARKTRALEEYRKGKCTIWKASEKAGIPLREMIELLRTEKVPLHISSEDVDEAWREAFEE